MKYTNADLTRWLQAANAALAENDIECVATSREGRGELRTPAGGIVTAWTSGKISAGGPEAPRNALLSVLASAELLVGFKDGAMGGMLLKLPETEQERTHTVDLSKVVVKITGPAGVGKSLIAEVIRETLTAKFGCAPTIC